MTEPVLRHASYLAALALAGTMAACDRRALGGHGGGGGGGGGDLGRGGDDGGGHGDRPGPGNTGVPLGTALMPSGSLTLTTPGQVIDALDIDGCVSVQARNVTIQRTRIRCQDYYPVRVLDGASLVIEDSEIAASGGKATAGIAFGSYTARRLDIHGSADGLKTDHDVVVEDSWIHDLWLDGGSGPGDADHADGAQSTGGSNVTLRHNFFDVVDHGRGHGATPSSCLQVGTENGSDGNWLVERNWLNGGGWVINFGGGGGNNRIIGNRFGRGASEVAGQPGYPEYGPLNVPDRQAMVSGNVWDDDGTAVDP